MMAGGIDQRPGPREGALAAETDTPQWSDICHEHDRRWTNGHRPKHEVIQHTIVRCKTRRIYLSIGSTTT